MTSGRVLRVLLGLILIVSGSALAQASNSYRVLNKGREGQNLTVTDYLAKGKLNIVAFTSPACPACQALEPKLSEWALKNSQVVVSRVVIDRPGSQGIDWHSPLARQYELRSVPYFKVYDATGKLLAEGEKARRMIAKLLIEAGVL